MINAQSWSFGTPLKLWDSIEALELHWSFGIPLNINKYSLDIVFYQYFGDLNTV